MINRRNRMLPVLLLLALLALPLYAARNAGIVDTDLVPDPAPGALKHEVVKTCGPARLIRVGKQRVLYLEGTHYEMGVQHGKLMGEEMQGIADSYIHYAARKGCGPEKLKQRAAAQRPFYPKYISEELKGLVKSSGIPMEKFEMLHSIPSFFHCTGIAVFNRASRDKHLYHTRSLDYAIDITSDGKAYAQDLALLIVENPTDGGYGHCYLSWGGFIGCLTGINERGISVGEMGSGSRDENPAGIPMVFMLRKVLEETATLKEATAVFEKGPRTCGFNFIVGDGNLPGAAAVEVTRSLCRIMPAGDKCNAEPPHTILPDAVWRVNHFVHPDTAATQRRAYDPMKHATISFLGHSVLAGYVEKNHGKLDGRSMVGALRLYPAFHPGLHQAVMAPGKGDIWVSHAVNPNDDRHPGAQNQPFYRYNLRTILGRKLAHKTE